MKKDYLFSMPVAAALNLLLLFGMPRAVISHDSIVETPHSSRSLPLPVIELDRPVEVDHSQENVEQPTERPIADIEKPDRPAEETLRPVEIGVSNETGIYVPSGPPNVGPGTFSDNGPINFGELDNIPKARVQVPPSFPYEARKDGRHGTVVLDFKVDERGNVYDAIVVRSSDRIFDQAALIAIAKWRFQPGTVHGQPVRFHMALPMEFKITED